MDNNVIGFDDSIQSECICTGELPPELADMRNRKLPPSDHIYHSLLDPAYADEDDGVMEMPYYPLELNEEPKPFPDDSATLDWTKEEPLFKEDIIV